MGLTLAAHLRRRSRADLEALLSVRPDLLGAEAGSWRALAEHASDEVSVRDALDHLDLFTFQLLDAVVLLGDGVSRRRFDEFVGPRATRAQLDAAFDRLERLALVWRDGSAVRLNKGLRYVMPSPPAGLPAAQRVAAMSGPQLQPVLRNLGLSDKGSVGDRRQRLLAFLRDRNALVARLDKAPASVPELLIDLVNRGAHVGWYEVTADPGLAEAMNWLRASGMLLPAGPHGFELPRELREMVLERVQLVRLDPAPPDLRGAAPGPAETARVDSAAILGITEVVHAVERVTEAVDAEPLALLKSGGVGVRDLKRLAIQIGRSAWEASGLLELAAAAGLVRAEGRARQPAPPLRQRQRRRPVATPEPGRVLVTETCDSWRELDTAARWAALVAGWAAHPRPLAMPDQPGQKLLPLQGCQLEPDVELPRLKRRMLDALDPAKVCAGGGPPPGTGQPAAEEALAAALHWAAPLTTPFLPGLVGLLMGEAETLGLVAFGRLAEPARRLRSARSVADLLPHPVRRVTLQADLTGLVAGPPARDLAALLDRAARRESRGGGTTWRFTADTVRAALDAGVDGPGLLAELTAVATHGVPEGLQVLIQDVARQHGRLRVATAGSVIRTEDAALAAEVAVGRALKPLQLRVLAPGVLVSPMPAPAVLEALRTAGYVPAHEDDKGMPVVERRPRPRAAEPGKGRGRAGRAGGSAGAAAACDARGTADVRGTAGAAGVSGTAGVAGTAESSGAPQAHGAAAPVADRQPEPAGLAALLSESLLSEPAGGPAGRTANPAELAQAVDCLLTAQAGSADEKGAVVIPFPRAGAASVTDDGALLPDGVATHMSDLERATLAEALATGRPVHLTYVDGQGRTSERTVERLDLDPPFLRGYCHLRREDRTFALSRVVTVTPA